MKFCLEALGCKVNQFEAEALARLAQQRGHTIVDKDADVCVLNTCTVTASGDHKNLRAIHRLRRDHPRAVLAVCGCMAQLEPGRLEGLADLVCGTQDRAQIVQACEDYVRTHVPQPTGQFRAWQPAFETLPPGVPRGRTRALLKIEDGCDAYCTYCIIPYARGHVRSLPQQQAVEQARALAQDGVKEIVVTGIKISSYGRDLHNTHLVQLTAALCQAVPEVRIRLGSLEPRTVDEAFCALAAYPNLMPHFHLSLQSGSDAVLGRMKRRYTAAQFVQRVQMLGQAFPDVSVTADLIVGFPGETEDDLQQSLDCIARCGLADVHVFPYSIRPGTPAARMPGQIPEQIKQQRALRAKQAAHAAAQAYRRRFLGRRLSVLWEHQDKEGFWYGHSPYAFQVKARGPLHKNQYQAVRVTDVQGDKVVGEIEN